jgi:hypothetical protein
MKLLIITGRAMRVYELGKALITLRDTRGIPIKTERPWHILPDDEAKEIARDLLKTGLYEREA